MNFIAQVEEHLRDLGTEARKKHPGVKEASERAILQLRALQNAYSTAVRKATQTGGPHPTTALFRSQDLLRPFLLATNYPNASPKLLDISFRAMRLLIEGNAICPGDGIHMVRVWTIQANVCASQHGSLSSLSHHHHLPSSNVGTSTTGSSSSSTSSSWFGAFALSSVGSSDSGVSSSTGHSGTGPVGPKKEHDRLTMEILDCLVMLLELRDLDVTEEQWSSSVALCCILLDISDNKKPSSTISLPQAARRSLQQVISLLYERNGDDLIAENTWTNLLHLACEPNKRESLTGAFSHCTTIVSHKTGPVPPPPDLCLDLLHLILVQRPELFGRKDSLGEMIPSTAIVLIELLRSTKCSFGILWRTLQLARSVVLSQNQEWTSVCHELLLELVYGITTATEACRNNHDFEDGFIYTAAAAASSLEVTEQSRRRSSSRVPPTTPLVPERLLWKAALVLEILHTILTDQPHVVLEKDGTLVAVVSEAVSDFATIAASCRDNILQVAECAKESCLDNADEPIRPAIFQRAADIGSIDVGAPLESAKATPMRKPGASGDSAPQPAPFPPCDIGEPVWIAFHCMLLLSRSLRKLSKEETSDADDDRIRVLMDGSFAPSLAVLQHYLKRFPGSNIIAKCALGGYANLADVAVPISHGTEMQRKALLSSLCKLSLPSWGKLGSTCQLQDHHVSALVCLLEIVHKNYDSILSEWHTVLRTLEELSTMPIASLNLSDDGYKGALAVAEAYARIAPLTACMSPESLSLLIDALADISISSIENRNRLADGDHVGVLPMEHHPQACRPDNNGADTRAERRTAPKGTGIDEGNPKESISGKLMSFAGRAISAGLGTSPPGDGVSNEQQNETSENIIPPDQRTRKTYYEDYRRSFSKRVLESKRATGNDIFRQLPFSLTALTDAAMCNSFRFESCGTSISTHLCALAAASSDIRPYAMDTLVMLVRSQLSEDSTVPASSTGLQMIVEEALTQSSYLAVQDANIEAAMFQDAKHGKDIIDDELQTMAHDVLLTPLCNTIRTTEQEDVAEAGIGALRSILEGAGHNLSEDAWVIVIDAVSSLSGDTSIGSGDFPANRSAAEWSTCCMLAFRCLKLIVDDFLEQLPHRTVASSMGARTALLDCCSTFGSSRHDVNTSLTAIGLLWTIADQDPDPNSIDHALSKLVLLSADSRTEVRNCSVNTLFSCLVGRGQRFSASRWEAIMFQTIFGVFDRISSRGEEDAENVATDATPAKGSSSTKQPKSRYNVKIHHSRDSAGKQWAATEVIALNGLNRVLRNFFSQLLATMDTGDDSNEEIDRNRENPWFETAWKRILDYALNSATQVGGRDTLDLRKAGVDLLILCTQLSCRAGIVAATTPARVGTNMEVVNGALRSVRGANSKTMEKEGQSSKTSELQNRWRQQLFLDSFRALENFRRHLEDDVMDDEDTSSYVETVQLQVLHRLSIGLGTLYECCKDEELSSSEEEDLERRFVELVAAVAKKAAGEPGARFLTQAQRTSFDLLRCMASNSSSEALKSIASLAGPSFFWVIRDDGDETGASNRGVEVMSHEAAKVIADEMSKESLPHESKVELLWRVLSAHVAEHENEGRDVSARQEKTLCYDMLLPVMKVGLQSAALLGEDLDTSSPGEENVSASDDSKRLTKEEKQQLLDSLWNRVFRVLSDMLSPVYAAPHSLHIPCTANLLGILAHVLAFAAPPQYDELCSVLSSGANNSMVVLKSQNSPSEGAVADIAELKIFKACFSGLCKLQPEGDALHSVTESALKDALIIIETDEGILPSRTDLGAEISLGVCESMQGFPHLDSLVLAVFPLLLKFTAVDHAGLRKELAAVMGQIDLGQVLDAARQKYERAEERAIKAERRNVELTAIIEELRDENESLQQQVAVFSASSALS